MGFVKLIMMSGGKPLVKIMVYNMGKLAAKWHKYLYRLILRDFLSFVKLLRSTLSIQPLNEHSTFGVAWIDVSKLYYLEIPNSTRF